MQHGMLSRDEIRRRVDALGPWFHNLDLQGVRTAPSHFLGDYPTVKWQRFRDIIPVSLTGMTVLDIGCNAGFYSMEMKRRGADCVVGIDTEDEYLAQARFAAEVNGLEIDFRKLSAYDVGILRQKFDLVLFMGVMYHLRHPLLALDLIHEHVAGDLLLFQSMQRGSPEMMQVPDNPPFTETAIFDEPGYPKLHFIESEYSNDPTNWWAPNAACTPATLRSAGCEILEHPEEEVFLCRRREIEIPPWSGPVYPAKGARG